MIKKYCDKCGKEILSYDDRDDIIVKIEKKYTNIQGIRWQGTRQGRKKHIPSCWAPYDFNIPSRDMERQKPTGIQCVPMLYVTSEPYKISSASMASMD